MKLAAVVVAVAGIGAGAAAFAHDNGSDVRERLSGFEEVPALSTSGSGSLRAFIDRGDDEIRYTLSFDDLESVPRLGARTERLTAIEGQWSNEPAASLPRSVIPMGPGMKRKNT